MDFPLTPKVVGQLLAELIIEAIDNGEENATNPMVWPVGALYGIEYQVRLKGEGCGYYTSSLEFFNTMEELDAWLTIKQNWVKQDKTHSILGEIYEWDWGPNLIASFRFK